MYISCARNVTSCAHGCVHNCFQFNICFTCYFQTELFDRSQFILFTVYFSLVCLMFLLQLFADKGALRWSDTTQSGEKIPLLSTDRTEGNTNKEAVQLDNKVTMQSSSRFEKQYQSGHYCKLSN